MEDENNLNANTGFTQNNGNTFSPSPQTVTPLQPEVERAAVPSPEPVVQNPPPAMATTTPTPVVVQPPVVMEPPATLATNTPNIAPPETKNVPSNKKRSKMIKVLAVVGLIVLFGAAVGGAYLVGKSHEKIIIRTPELRPIDLPPQAIVVSECVVGRGKQFILPKDIPIGPVYDVVNSKVIAIEYSLDVAGLISNSDVFSDTVLKFAKEYPVDHLSIVPVAPKPGQQVQSIQLIMFVVSKSDASKITCK